MNPLIYLIAGSWIVAILISVGCLVPGIMLFLGFKAKWLTIPLYLMFKDHLIKDPDSKFLPATAILIGFTILLLIAGVIIMFGNGLWPFALALIPWIIVCICVIVYIMGAFKARLTL